MSLQNKVTPLTLELIDAPFTGVWQLLYPGFEQPIFMIRIINDSDTGLLVSYDSAIIGQVTNDYVAEHDTIQIYFQANAQLNYTPANLSQGRKVWIRSLAAGGNGLVACTGYTSYR